MTERIQIRTARASEREALEQLQWRASLTNAGDRDALLAHPDAIELPVEQVLGGRVFVAESADGLLGFAAVEPRDDGDSELDALFVDPNARRRGIAKQLVEYCTGIARARGGSALWVIGNPHAEDFYLACGFDAMGSTETRFGPGLLMRRKV